MKLNRDEKDRLQTLSHLVIGDEKFLSMKVGELKDHINKISHELDLEWIESGYSDFSLYHRPDYLYSVINCYYLASKYTVRGAVKWFLENGIDMSQMTVFEDYNGLGLTTLDLLQHGNFKEVTYFNDVDIQIEACKKILDHYGLEHPKHTLERTGKYDVVISSETAEHYQNPDEYLDSICSLVKDGGYLVFATTVNPNYLGHFPVYTVDGVDYTRNGANAAIGRKIVSNGFERIHVAFNGKPVIFKKN